MENCHNKSIGVVYEKGDKEMSTLKETIKEAQETENKPAKKKEYNIPLEPTYLGIPLVGKAPVDYMAGRFNPRYEMPDGSITYGYIRKTNKEKNPDLNIVYKDRTKDILTDSIFSAKELLDVFSVTETNNEKLKSYSSRYSRTDFQDAGITYGRHVEDLGNPVFFFLKDSYKASLEKSRNGQKDDISKKSMNSMVFFVKNQEDLDKLQHFCLVNMGQAVTVEGQSDYRRRRFLEGLKSLYSILSKPDARLDSLPGKPTRKILSGEELDGFLKQVDEKFENKLAQEAKERAAKRAAAEKLSSR